MLVVYEYDEMNRLEVLTHYQPGAQPVALEYASPLARYEYTLRDDGTREKAVETTWFDDTGDGVPDAHTSTTEWDYDALGRLIEESIDHYTDSLDRTEHFLYDLAGNRLRQTVDVRSDGAATADEVTDYAYDANDRLLTEELDRDGDGTPERTTTYGYKHTQQWTKEVREGAVRQGRTEFAYDLQGRLAEATVEAYDAGGVLARRETTTYGYDAGGIRVSAHNLVDSDGDGDVDEESRTEYLNDDQNHTGYSQVLRETTKDGAGQVQEVVVYALGHDQIGQATIEYANGQPASSTALFFGADGHGSTRFLTGSDGLVAVHGLRPQVFDYSAYGELLNMGADQAATSFLYSGEPFDARVGLQYLRARWYDPNTGRFNQLDPFFGDLQEPQSLHKYAYVHDDPVNGVDPTGLFEGLIGLMSTISIGSDARGKDAAASLSVLNQSKTATQAIRLVSQLQNTLGRAQRGLNFVLDVLQFDPMDMIELAKALDPMVLVPTDVQVGPIVVPLPDKITQLIKYIYKIIPSRSMRDEFTEYVGELATAVVAYAMGFEKAQTENYPGVQGIDLLAINRSMGPNGLWGVFEAKGGGSKLKDTKTYGREMNGRWITYWLDDTNERSRKEGSPDGPALSSAIQTKSTMLAMVVRANFRQQSADPKYYVKVAVQAYRYPSKKNRTSDSTPPTQWTNMR